MVKQRSVREILTTLLLEFIIYGLVVLAYFFVVLRYLGDWLDRLYQENLFIYAFICLGLIIIQGLFLDFVHTFLLTNLRLDRLE